MAEVQNLSPRYRVYAYDDYLSHIGKYIRLAADMGQRSGNTERFILQQIPSIPHTGSLP